MSEDTISVLVVALVWPLVVGFAFRWNVARAVMHAADKLEFEKAKAEFARMPAKTPADEKRRLPPAPPCELHWGT